MTQFENFSKNFNLSKNQQFAVLGQAKKNTQKNKNKNAKTKQNNNQKQQ